MMDTERSFKYGDKILLKNKPQGLFLGSRGTDLYSGYYVKTPEESYLENPYLYPNLLELVFEIHPQLNYEAAKEYHELTMDDPNKSNAEKRMRLEENLNKTKLVENKDKPIYLGSTVQLFHIATRTYLQIAPQKIADTEMGVIGSSHSTNENAQFMLSLPFSFYKKGTPLNYDNSFILQDNMKKTLAYPLNNTVWNKLEMKLKAPPPSEGFAWLNPFTNRTNDVRYPLPYVVENQTFFKGYMAGYVSLSDIGTEYGNDFQAVNVSGYFERLEGAILWGNTVTLKKMDTTTGQVSMLVSEVNRSSVKNTANYRFIDHIELKKVVSIEANFQIVPLNPALVGSNIKYDSNKSVVCLLKCALSGRFLKEDPTRRELVVCESFEVEKEVMVKNKSKLEENLKAKQTRYLSGGYAQGEFTQLEADWFQTKNKEFFKKENDKDYFLEFLRSITFRLQKMSSDDDQYINNSNFFKILTPSGKALKVNDAKLPVDEPKDTRSEPFLNCFISKLRTMYVQEHRVDTMSGANEFDLFFFQDGSRALEFALSKLTPLLPTLCQAPTAESIDTPFLMDFYESVIRLQRIFNEIVYERELDKTEVQNLYRQASVIDLIMRFLTQIVEANQIDAGMLSSAVDACRESVFLLEMLVKGNKINALYLFQWKNFINSAILNNQLEIFSETNIDSVYFALIDILQFYWVYTQDFIEPLCSRIKFENFDCHKIEILIKILNSFRNSSDEKSMEIIYQNIFKPSNLKEIFRPLQRDGDGEIFVRSDIQSILINERLLENQEKYTYLTQVFKLGALLAELDLLKVCKQLVEIFPKEETMTVIEKEDMPDEFRCILLNIFSALYYLNPVYHYKVIKFMDKVVVSEDLSTVHTPGGQEGRLRRGNSFLGGGSLLNSHAESKFSAALDRVDLGDIIVNVDNKSSLNRFIQEGQKNKAILSSSLKVFMQLLDTNFFVKEEIVELKGRIERIIATDSDIDLSSRTIQRSNMRYMHNSTLHPKKHGTVNFDINVMARRQLIETSHIIGGYSQFIERGEEENEDDIGNKAEKYEHLTLFLDILLKVNERLLVIELRDSLASKKETKKVKREATIAYPSPDRSTDTFRVRTKAKYGTNLQGVKFNPVAPPPNTYIAPVDAGQKVEVRADTLTNLIGDLKMRSQDKTAKMVFHWLNLNIPTLFFKVLQYYHKVCRQKYFLFKTLQSHHLIENLEEKGRYEKYKNACTSILKSIRNISKDYSHKENPDRAKNQMIQIYEVLQERFMDFFIPVSSDDRIRHLEYSLREQFDPQAEASVKGQLSIKDQGILANTLNLFFMRLDMIANHQLLILKSGFLSLIIEVLQFFNHRVFTKTPALKNISFGDLSIFDESLFSSKRDSGYNQLNLAILMLIYYCTYNNANVVEQLRTEPVGERLMEILLGNLSSQEMIFKKVSLMILTFIFGSSFDTIYSLGKRFRSSLIRVVEEFDRENKAKNYEILVNYLELFSRSTTFHNLCFEKNYEIIHGVIEGGEQTKKSSSSLVAKLMNEDVKVCLNNLFKNGGGLKAATTKKDFKKVRQANISSGRRSADVSPRQTQVPSAVSPVASNNRLELIDDIDEYDSVFSIINIPGIVVYSNELLKFFGHIGHLASIDLKMEIRKLVSLDSILTVFNSTKQLWFFKITILKFLQTIFLNQKLDLKGKGQIFTFIRESLLGDVKEYFRSRHDNKYTNHIYMLSEFTQINSLLLKREEELRPCFNYFCFEYHDAQYYYIRESVVSFIKSFTTICHIDKNSTMLDNIQELIEEQRFRSPVVILNSALQDQNPESFKLTHSAEKKKSSYHFSIGKDSIDAKKLADTKKNEIFGKIARLFEEDTMRENIYSQMVESEETDQLLIRELISKDFEVNNLQATRSIKAQYLVEFAEFNKILKTELEKEEREDINSYENFINEACMLIGSSRSASIDVCLLCRYLCEQLKLNKTSEDPQAHVFIDNLVDFRLVTNIISCLALREHDKDVATKVTTLLKEILACGNPRFQDALHDELAKDVDNKFPNTIAYYLDQAVSNFIELETLRNQVTSGTTKISYKRLDILEKIAEKTDKQIEGMCSTIEMLRLMCEGHYLKLQNYLRVQTMGNNLLKPYQVNFIERTIMFFKTYMKMIKDENDVVATTLLRFLIELVQGPCKDNQLEVIKKKLLEPLEDFHCNLIYSTISLNRETRIELINLILTLKLGIIESTQDKLIIKTLAISLNLDIIWVRILAIYCDLNNIRMLIRQYAKTRELRTTSLEGTSPLNREDMFNNLLEVNEEREDMTTTKTKKKDLHSSYSINMVEALNSLILLSQLSNFGEDITKIIEASFTRMADEYKVLVKARKFFTEKIQSIEYVDEEQNLQTLYFSIHPKTEFLSKFSIFTFEENVDRRNWTAKANDLIRFVPKAYLEIKHNYSLYNMVGIHVSVSSFYVLKVINFSIAIVINLINMISPNMSDEVNEPEVFHPWHRASGVERSAIILGLIMLCNYVIALFLYVVYEFIVKLRIFNLEERELEIAHMQLQGEAITEGTYATLKKYVRMIYKILFETKIILVSSLLLFCVLGLTRSKLFFSFLLLDIVEISPLLLSVIRSVTLNFAALSTTWGFILIMCFIYSSIAYYTDSIRNNYTLLNQPDLINCRTFPTCYWNTMLYGIKSGGGIGEVLQVPDSFKEQNHYISRTIFDIVFFVTMILILMNIILGIIIDSFAELREQRYQVEDDMNNVCFVCGITKQDFNNNGISFSKHTRLVHHHWNYVFYIIGLLEKDPNEYSGIESYLARKYMEKELDWLPFQQTALLNKKSISEEEARELKIKRIEELVSKYIEKKRRQRNKAKEARLAKNHLSNAINIIRE